MGVVVDFVVVGGRVVDVVKTSPILPIAINAADKVGDDMYCCWCCCLLL